MTKKKIPEQATFPMTRKDLMNLLHFEKLRVELALIVTGGNRSETAKVLNMTVRNLHRKLVQYDLKLKPEENV